MDPEDDMHDDDCYYSGDETMIASGDDDDGDGDDEFSIDSKSNRQQKKNYKILNEEDISERMEEDITTISVFTGSRESASILLRHYNWIVSKVNDAWFADEEKVRRETGLLELDQITANDVKKKKKLSCGICFDSYPLDVMNAAAACGHYFCRECWMGYVGSSISDGPGCLMLRCPEPSCGAAVGQDMINLFASDEDKQKYSLYLLRSYIEHNKMAKWCPAPGCEFAVEVDSVVGSANYDVSCKCTNRFCWNCTEDVHRPIDCTTVAKWVLKNSSEAENTNWMLVNTKLCPKCKRPIEKNQGCMHMVCTPPCKFHFCWLCLGAWSDHGAETGGFYACNSYSKAKQEGKFNEAENRREMAKRSIERYTHYYERWATNQKSRLKAGADLKLMQTVHMGKLSDEYCQPESQLKFITEAWLQIIECRRVLKWTYAYGYYIPEQERPKRQFFEYLQGEAESGLERLHQCVEKDLEGYLNSNGPSKDFNEFRKKLVGLTNVTRNYFENLVQALENGLSDVDSQAVACSQSGILENSAPMPIGKRPSRVVEDSCWSCEQCTYTNFDMTIMDCQMCQLPKFY